MKKKIHVENPMEMSWMYLSKIIFGGSSLIDLGTRVSLDTCLGNLWEEKLWRDISYICGIKSALGL